MNRVFANRLSLGFLALPCLLAALALGGCGGGDSTATGSPGAGGSATTGPTEAVLHPVAEIKASGRVEAVRGDGKMLIKLRIDGLKPAIGETMYVPWLMSSRHSMYAMGAFRVRGDGKLHEDMVAPNAFLHLESGKNRFLLTRIYSDDAWRDSYSETDDPYDPAMIGRPIMEGTFHGPFVE